MAADKKQPVFVTVDALRPDSRGVNVTVKVIEAAVVVSRPRGPKGALKVSECLVGDHTGCVLFTAKNEQADLAQPGAIVTLRNARIDMFRGSMRLVVDQWGKVEAAELSDIKANTSNNLSLIEFELVTLPTGEVAS